MYEQLLTQTGLSPNQATIYELLLQEGLSKASKISQKSPLKRGLVYKTLDELVELKLAKKEEKSGSIAIFTAEHPTALRDLIKNQETKVERAKTGINQLLPQLVSEFNLSLGKPGVKFYEGQVGIETVLNDSLTATGQIYSYTCPEEVDDHLKDFNLKYTKMRRQKEIIKKILVADSNSNRQRYQNLDQTITQVKFLDPAVTSFPTVMQIYNNKISYVTLTDRGAIGIIIEDSNITQMHKILFESAWRSAKN